MSLFLNENPFVVKICTKIEEIKIKLIYKTVFEVKINFNTKIQIFNNFIFELDQSMV